LTGKTGIDAVSRLPWQAGIHSTSGLTACAGKRIARTILQEFRRCSAGQRAARDRSGVAEAAGWSAGADISASDIWQIKKILHITC
jgi:hypothetical protein